MNLHD